MKKLDYIIFSILLLITLLSRIPFIEQMQSHWDGPQYSIAIIRYSFEQHTPGPPGYPLYIALGKFFYLFTHDIHKAILAVSVLGSVLGVLALYLIGKQFYNRYVGITAATIFLTGSTFYYFGLTPYAYGLLPAATAMLAYIVYQIFIKKKQYGLLLGIVFGICFSIRPQETIQTGILPLLGFIFLSKKEKIKSILVFLIITLLWLIPVVDANGGLQQFFFVSYQFAQGALFNHSIFHRIELMIKGYLLSFGLAGGFLLYFIFKIIKITKSTLKKNSKIIIFWAAWLVPGLLYNLFIRTEHAGYQMSYLTGLLILISYAIWQTTKKSKWLFFAILAGIALFNLYWFFYDRDPEYVKPYRPTSFHYSDIKKNDLKTGSKVAFVKKHFSPQDTLIVSTEVMWRPYSYYLPEYHYIVLFRLDNTDIPYSYNKIVSQKIDMQWSQEQNFVLTVPRDITRIVFMDDPMPSWIKKYPFTAYRLPGNSVITEVSVQPEDKLFYNYHDLTVRQ